MLWLAAAVLVVVAGFARRRRGRIWSGVSLALRFLIAAAAVAALAAPFRIVPERLRPRVDVVIDASRSVGREEIAAVVAIAEEWRRTSEADVRVSTFGSDDASASFRSDPARAVAASLLEPSPGGDLFFMATDGRIEPPGAGQVFVAPERLPRVVTIGPSVPRGVRVLSLTPVPLSGGSGESAVDLRGTADVACRAKAEIYIDGALFRELPFECKPGAFSERLPIGVRPPGRSLVAVRVVLDGATDAEPLDDEAGCVLNIPEPLRVLVAAPEARSAIGDALKAQGLDVTAVVDAECLKAPGMIDAFGAVVLDRTSIVGLSEAAVLARFDAFVRRGGGLWFLPRDPETARNELVPSSDRGFLGLLPFIGREEPKIKPPEPPPDPPTPEAPPGLKPPDPDKKNTERREAPSLGLLLLIDASGSMRGQKIRLAQVAAVKAAETLHPEDQVGVVAFNDGVIEVVPLGPAADLDFVRSQVSRIRAGGNTDFRVALEAARDVFAAEKLQIKHCILLSDGFSTTGGAFSKLARELRDAGVTVSTVGVGVEADIEALSNIAAAGGGKYQGAPDIAEVPQIFVVEAERLLRESKARRRGDPLTEKPKKPDEKPEPAEPSPPDPARSPAPKDDASAEPAARIAIPILPAWPAAYLKGTSPEKAVGIFGRHKVETVRAAWPSIKTEPGDPVVAHHYLGFGRVVAQTVAFEGPSAGPWFGWDDLSNFAAQVVRFLAPDAPLERFQVSLSIEGRVVRLHIDDVEGEPEPPTGYGILVRDQRGRRLDVAWRILDSTQREAVLPDGDGTTFIDVAVTTPAGPGEGRASGALGLAREIETVGVDPAGAEVWARALGGRMQDALPAVLELPRITRDRRVFELPSWFPFVLLALLVDLALKRILPGVFSARPSKAGSPT